MSKKKSIEYKNLNLINVPYGFGWTRRDCKGMVSGSTHPLGNLLPEIDKEMSSLKAEIKELQEELQAEREVVDEISGYTKQDFEYCRNGHSYYSSMVSDDLCEQCGEYKDGPGGSLKVYIPTFSAKRARQRQAERKIKCTVKKA